MTPRGRIPVTVIGGFLGAGKTTLVNHLLREGGGAGRARRVAVLVNDFGDLNVDASLVDATTADTIALGSGCVCCQIGDDLFGALVRVIEAEDPFDAIVVEASGVSDPWRVAQIALAEPTLTLESVIVVVDADAALGHARDPALADTLVRQLRAADLVVLNKVDRTDPERLENARAWIAETAGRIAILQAVDARISPAWLVGLREVEPSLPTHGLSGARTLHDAHLQRADHGVEFESWSARPEGRFSVATLRAWVKSPPDRLLRLKGLLRTDDAGWVDVQFAGRHGSVRAALRPPENGLPSLVAISRRGDMPTADLACLSAGPGRGGPKCAAGLRARSNRRIDHREGSVMSALPSTKPMPHPRSAAAGAARRAGDTQANDGSARESILEAARAEFSAKGLNGARVNEIAARAGVNKQLLYYYFGGKDDLYRAALEAVYAEIRTLERGLQLGDLPPIQAMETLIGSSFDYLLQHPEFIGMLNHENAGGARHVRASPVLGGTASPLIDLIGKTLKRGVRSHVFRAGIDPVELYISLAGMSYFFFSNRLTLASIFKRDLNHPTAVKSYRRHVVTLAMAGLRA